MTHQEFVDEYNYLTAISEEELDPDTQQALHEIIDNMMLVNCESTVPFEIDSRGRIKLLTIDTKSDTVNET